MTRHERAIEAAKRRLFAANAARMKAYDTLRAAIEAVERKHRSLVWAANRKAMECRHALALAELAAHGIVPMKTIILYHPKGYTSPAAQNRYVVRVSSNGSNSLVPVGKKGAILQGRNPVPPPYDWNRVKVTGEELQV